MEQVPPQPENTECGAASESQEKNGSPDQEVRDDDDVVIQDSSEEEWLELQRQRLQREAESRGQAGGYRHTD